jgi:hypothetical protein
MTFNSMFSCTSENLKICINNIETQNLLQINKNKNDCSKFCFDKGLKIDLKYNICVLYCSEGEYKYEYNNICYEKCPNKTFISKKNEFLCVDTEDNDDYEILLEDKYIMTLRELIINDNIIENIVKNKTDYIRKINNVTYQITTTDNQRNNKNYTISSIDLEDCEETLRYKYDINQSFPLIIFKIDYKSPDTLIPIVGYEIYHPLNKTKLDLSECKNIKLNIPVSINENDLFKHDPNSNFYNDDCFSYTSENGTDIILNDRKQEFKDKNL